MDIENVAAKVHTAYCVEHKRRTGEDYWTKGDYSLLKDEIKELDRVTARVVMSAVLDEVRRLREAVEDISRQHLESEMPEDERDGGDYRAAYDCMIRVARAALASTEPEVCRCRWSEDEAAWVHDCGMRWYLLNDSPTKAIGANYCPKCGLKLEVVNEEDSNG